MAKNWIKIDTIYSPIAPETREERQRKTKRYNHLMATTETLSAKDLKKKSIEAYNENKEKENNLLQAYDDKKLKSENAIKQAIRLKKERAKKQNSAKQDTKKVSENKETTESTV